MGHSFGGAVAIRTAVVMTGSVTGVVTFAAQSAGCEVAGALAGRPLLLFHGDRDEILPAQASEIVQAMAGVGDLEIIPGDGHLLAKSDDLIAEREKIAAREKELLDLGLRPLREEEAEQRDAPAGTARR